jgi:hypothetical protein
MGDIMEQEENLDLLDLDQDNGVDTLPEAAPFANPRPKKPWLLMVLGIAIIVLATWIIVARIGGDNGTSVSVDLDTPVVVDDKANEDLNVPAKPVDVAPQPVPAPVPVAVMVPPAVEPAPVVMEPKPAPMVQPVADDGNPVRVVADRKDVTFNPDKPESKKPVAKAPAKKSTAPVKKSVASSTNGGIYVQFGSYSTRELAQKAEQKMRASHGNLFNGKQFVILAANVKGETKYRLRVAFHNANEANGFCRNAKSDGLDCYVTK